MIIFGNNEFNSGINYPLFNNRLLGGFFVSENSFPRSFINNRKKMKNYIVIKFNKAAIQSRTNETLTLKTFATQDNFLNKFAYRSIVTDEMLSPQRKINTVNFENLVGICCVQGLDEMLVEEKESLAKKMDAYDFVEYAYVEAIEPPILPVNPDESNEKISVYKKGNKIPDFTDLQGYKDGIEDKHIGIDMEYAWDIGVTGEGVSCAVIESGFELNHVNLKRKTFVPLFSDDNVDGHNHGTSTAGIMYGNDIGYGIKGMVHGADAFYATCITDMGIVGTLAELFSYLESGDVISISRGYKWAPLDKDKGFWEVAKEGLEAGIIICISASNGANDLDADDRLETWRTRPDIGIIRVGAGNELLSKASFSNWGSMIHLQAWGTWNVVTTGKGNLYNGGDHKTYTDSFSGTSAACPIVASAAVAVQSWYKNQTGDVLTPFEMRDLLIETGIPQPKKDSVKWHIGPIPNVCNAIEELEQRLQLRAKC